MNHTKKSILINNMFHAQHQTIICYVRRISETMYNMNDIHDESEMMKISDIRREGRVSTGR